MYIGEPCKLTGDAQAPSDHYVALVNIIEHAQSAGLELGELICLIQDESASGTIPLATVGELIKKMRRTLYQQMMEFEILDSDLADLQSDLLEGVEKPEVQTVTLTLVKEVANGCHGENRRLLAPDRG